MVHLKLLYFAIVGLFSYGDAAKCDRRIGGNYTLNAIWDFTKTDSYVSIPGGKSTLNIRPADGHPDNAKDNIIPYEVNIQISTGNRIWNIVNVTCDELLIRGVTRVRSTRKKTSAAVRKAETVIKRVLQNMTSFVFEDVDDNYLDMESANNGLIEWGRVRQGVDDDCFRN